MKLSFEKYSDGKTLCGDDFSPEDIEAWFRDEAEAYFNLPLEQELGVYSYHARNWRHGFRHLPPTPFEHVLCLGGAFGDELRPVVDRSKKVTILEPSGGYQNPKFEYVKPDPYGRMPFADNTFDLVTCFGVLHHIPNVSTVMNEMARCTRPSGWQLICEPTHSMGNWERPRRFLTTRERGIPLPILRKIVVDAGMRIVRQRRCGFPLTSRLQHLFPKRSFVFNKNWITAIDDYVSNFPLWTERYHPSNVFQRLRPWSLFLVLRKNP